MDRFISHTKSALAVTFSFLFPAVSKAADYSGDGAVLLGSRTNEHTSNVVAALMGANFSFTCLVIVVLQIASIYIFHQIWHPRRVHEEMSKQEKRWGTLRFFVGGTIVWMAISVMSRSWCVILPLIIFLLALFAWYATTILAPEKNSFFY